MSPHVTYHLYQAERTRSAAEVREADARIGELAATALLIGRSVGWPARSLVTLAGRHPAPAGRRRSPRGPG